ncbi:protein phosphatase 2C domain-containing protein [Toxoplasma gondii GT1]|uniref:Protein phosphatase 2C domain-containing protein n=2 Tax=Toxoplasma gondii TaxID=5811 RepID=S7UR00_TOXGG|nr:protein phosphatase 2C domain-containing protein [Toxoplasma gondii GT1]KAF4640132.1 protein phosphatase 2C domain-containing protein [Toxoplasma gondii]
MQLCLPPAPPGARRLCRLPIHLASASKFCGPFDLLFLLFFLLSTCGGRGVFAPLSARGDGLEPRGVASVPATDSSRRAEAIPQTRRELTQPSSSSSDKSRVNESSEFPDRLPANAPLADEIEVPAEWLALLSREPAGVSFPSTSAPPAIPKWKERNDLLPPGRLAKSGESVAAQRPLASHVAAPGSRLSRHSRGGQPQDAADVRQQPSSPVSFGAQQAPGGRADAQRGGERQPEGVASEQGSGRGEPRDAAVHANWHSSFQAEPEDEGLFQSGAASEVPRGGSLPEEVFHSAPRHGQAPGKDGGESVSAARAVGSPASQFQANAPYVTVASQESRGGDAVVSEGGLSAAPPDEPQRGSLGRVLQRQSPRTSNAPAHPEVVELAPRLEKDSLAQRGKAESSEFADGDKEGRSSARDSSLLSLFRPTGILESLLPDDFARDVRASVLRKTGQVQEEYLRPGWRSVALALNSLFSREPSAARDTALGSSETYGGPELSDSPADDRDLERRGKQQAGVGARVFANLGLREEFISVLRAVQQVKESLGLDESQSVSPPPSPSQRGKKKVLPPYQVQVRKKMVTVSEWYVRSLGATMNGRRTDDEDALLVHSPLAGFPDARLVGLFDGHAGYEVSRFCATHASSFLGTMTDLSAASFKEACLAMDDAAFRQSVPMLRSGSTGIMVVIEQKWSRAGHLFFRVHAANVGDSRAFLLRRDGSFVTLSADHKPNDPDERQRIESAGGHVKKMGNGIWRLDGSLALSRAFGDFRLKQEPSLPADAQRVVAVPDVVQTFAEPGDILFLACDGMFEARGMTWSGVAALLKESLEEMRGDLPRVAYKLLDSAFTRGSRDNISLIITRLDEVWSPASTISRFDYDALGKVTVEPAIVNGERVDLRAVDGAAVHPEGEPVQVTLF